MKGLFKSIRARFHNDIYTKFNIAEENINATSFEIKQSLELMNNAIYENLMDNNKAIEGLRNDIICINKIINENQKVSNLSISSPVEKLVPYIVTGDIHDTARLYEFCKKFEKLYILGTNDEAQYLQKLFHDSGVKIDALIDIYNANGENLADDNIGVIVAYREHIRKDALSFLANMNCKNIYCPTDLTLWATANKLKPRPRERMWIEINIADHCNLNCRFCDHFSQLSKPFCLDIETFERDIKRLAELTNGHIDIIKLQGGEPLLNIDIAKHIEIARKHFRNAKIILFSNGLLLEKSESFKGGNVLQAMKDNDVALRMTFYPLTFDIAKAVKKAHEYGIYVEEITNYKDTAVEADENSLSKLEIKEMVKHPFYSNGGSNNFEWINCYQLNESIVLRDGKLFTCPQTAYIDIFNEKFGADFELTENDYLDIFKAKSYFELSEFCAKRIPFCKNCAVFKRTPHDWKTSTRLIDEYILNDD